MCAEKQGRERGPTLLSATWIWKGVNVLDGRRLEVVADGLTLWHGDQLAINTTLVSALHRMARPGGQRPRPQAGAALKQARLLKETTYPSSREKEEKHALAVLVCRSRGGDCLMRRHSSCALHPKLTPDSTPDPPEPRQCGMAPQMEQQLGLQHSQDFRVISPGQAPESWNRG